MRGACSVARIHPVGVDYEEKSRPCSVASARRRPGRRAKRPSAQSRWRSEGASTARPGMRTMPPFSTPAARPSSPGSAPLPSCLPDEAARLAPRVREEPRLRLGPARPGQEGPRLQCQNFRGVLELDLQGLEGRPGVDVDRRPSKTENHAVELHGMDQSFNAQEARDVVARQNPARHARYPIWDGGPAHQRDGGGQLGRWRELVTLISE